MEVILKMQYVTVGQFLKDNCDLSYSDMQICIEHESEKQVNNNSISTDKILLPCDVVEEVPRKKQKCSVMNSGHIESDNKILILEAEKTGKQTLTMKDGMSA
ncbi:uncharacterized protein LOC113561856 isoform X1 [Ooceraea biroi]|uniref:uncharacterized protein LOC113561856 isoform X1 n=1 Tax=Ooceraea biroi TaxID=2015173 RepID=UPI000F081DC7|nr:uncharacterized protein LOC113561856 isoform X1 [Ooceraea biroi]